MFELFLETVIIGCLAAIILGAVHAPEWAVMGTIWVVLIRYHFILWRNDLAKPRGFRMLHIVFMGATIIAALRSSLVLPYFILVWIGRNVYDRWEARYYTLIHSQNGDGSANQESEGGHQTDESLSSQEP